MTSRKPLKVGVLKFKGDVGKGSDCYKTWWQILDSEGRGIEIEIYPKIAKKLGLEIGMMNFELRAVRCPPHKRRAK